MNWMTKQTIPSEHLLMTQNQDNWFKHYTVQSSSKETLAGWRNGITGITGKFNKEKSCTWGRTTPGNCWGPPSWKGTWQKMTQRSQWIPSFTENDNVPLCLRRLTVSWAAFGGALPSGQGEWSFPFTGEALPGVLCSILGSPIQGKMELWRFGLDGDFLCSYDAREDPAKGTKDEEGTGAHVLQGKTVSWHSSVWRKGLRGGSQQCIQIPKENLRKA